jgi:hypothetical protein
MSRRIFLLLRHKVYFINTICSKFEQKQELLLPFGFGICMLFRGQSFQKLAQVANSCLQFDKRNFFKTCQIANFVDKLIFSKECFSLIHLYCHKMYKISVKKIFLTTKKM